MKAGVLPKEIVSKLREITFQVLEAEAAKDPQTKKVHDAFMAFRAKHRAWSEISEKPYHEYLS